ncbi:hypothetical protein GF415_00240 [Candidatus Micrarchaeota archaeon]|nr:hypothetical protein [Candidatus Micrarchaeota archaeon]
MSRNAFRPSQRQENPDRETVPAKPSTLHPRNRLHKKPSIAEGLGGRSIAMPCGPGKKDTVSSSLLDNGYTFDRAEGFVSLVKQLCPPLEEEPNVEITEREVWVGRNRVGRVISLNPEEEDAELHIKIPLEELLEPFLPEAELLENKHFSPLRRILGNTRTLSTIVAAFGMEYGKLSLAMDRNAFAELAAHPGTTFLHFYNSERTITRSFWSGGDPHSIFPGKR